MLLLHVIVGIYNNIQQPTHLRTKSSLTYINCPVSLTINPSVITKLLTFLAAKGYSSFFFHFRE